MKIHSPNAGPGGLSPWRIEFKLETLAHPLFRTLEASLAALAQEPPELDTARDDAAFMVLLESEEYDVFVDLFSRYQQLCISAFDSDPASWKHLLPLRLSPGWAPKEPDKLLAAFDRIRVDTLWVLSQKDSAGKAPEAASQVLVKLLQRGLTDLKIDAVLSHPLAVAQAFCNSALKSIELGHEELGKASLGADGLAGFETLLQGLGHCGSLKKLTLGHRDLLRLHADVDQWLTQADRPQLDAVELNDCGEVGCARAADMTLMLKVLCKMPSLSSVYVRADVGDAATMKAAILEPMKGHGALGRLTICAAKGYQVDANSAFYMTDMFGLAATCPGLKHIELKSMGEYPLAFDDMSEYLLAGGNLAAPRAVAEMKDALARGVGVETIVCEGLLLIPGPVLELAAYMREDGWIKKIDVSNCSTDLASELALVDALQDSKSMVDLVITTDHAQRCFLSSDGSICSFSGRSLVDEQGVPKNFELTFPRRVKEQVKRVAQEAFEPLAAKAKAMVTTIESHRRRRLEQPIASLMGDMYRSTPGGSEADFSNVASGVAGVLDAQGHFADALGLRAVNRQAAGWAEWTSDVPTTTSSTSPTTTATTTTTTSETVATAASTSTTSTTATAAVQASTEPAQRTDVRSSNQKS